MSAQTPINRRDFLKVSAVAGAGLVIGVYLSGCSETPTPTGTATSSPTGTLEQPESPSVTPEGPAWLEPNVFLKIGNDGGVTITVPRSEMGQGVRTACAMIVADELGADWASVRVEQAPGDSVYGDQHTGGSRSIQQTFQPLRRAGAVGRALMIAAAAQIWGVAPEACYSEKGVVIHQPTGQQLAFGELVINAGSLPVPKEREVPLKDPQDFRIIGTSVGRVDNPDIVMGKATFGLDVRLPGMLFASLARPPAFGAKLLGFNQDNALGIPGVRHVLQIDGGLAVLAENTWAALRGREALEAAWDEGKTDLNSAELEESLLEQAKQSSPERESELVSYYVMPFLGHATMEPMNCTADLRSESCEIWVPTQSPQDVKQRVTMLTRLPDKAVRVNVTLLGGGFGRRLESGSAGPPPAEYDYVSQAVQLSQAAGTPVQVAWTREDDFRFDLFHPLSVTRVSARLDDIGSLEMRRFQATAVPTGYWRAVTNVPEAFAHESFLDEYAAATGSDPLEIRRQTLPDRHWAVLELAANKANWGSSLRAGFSRGIACHATWGVSPVAQVAEVAVVQGRVRVQRVVCAIDCGLAINPDMVVAQMESGIVLGLSAALKAAITIEKGRVVQTNFEGYPLLRLDEMPAIEVYIVPSQERPTGVGEMGNPPIAPAVANAVFAATGQRVRRLPILLE